MYVKLIKKYSNNKAVSIYIYWYTVYLVLSGWPSFNYIYLAYQYNK